MTVVVRSHSGALLDHIAFIKEEWGLERKDGSRAAVEKLSNLQYRWKRELFHVFSPFLMDSELLRMKREEKESHEDSVETPRQRKRRKKKEAREQEMPPDQAASRIQDVLPSIVAKGREFGHLRMEPIPLSLADNNLSARMAGNAPGCGDLFQEACRSVAEEAHEKDQTNKSLPDLIILQNKDRLPVSAVVEKLCRNDSQQPIRVSVEDHTFVVPERSSFLTCSFQRFTSVSYHSVRCEDGYDLVVVDPPWPNKSVKRKKSYSMIEEWDVASIPVPALCSNEALVCLWVTNNQRLMDFVKENLFPAWGVEWCSDWIWMKITQSGEPVHPFNSNKKPYEQLILGRYRGLEGTSTKTPTEIAGSNASTKPKVFPKNYVLVSIPCALHSKKPPLLEVLRPFLPPTPRCLELFARNLGVGWTSWGNEPLRHQHLDYFENVP